MAGLPEVRQALAAHSERYTGLALDWKTQVLITSGATEALAAAFFGLLEPGDEVGRWGWWRWLNRGPDKRV